MRDHLGPDADVAVLRQLTTLVVLGLFGTLGVMAFLVFSSLQAVSAIDETVSLREREQVLRAIAASPTPINAVSADAIAQTLALINPRFASNDSLRPGELQVPIGNNFVLAWQPHHIAGETFLQIAPLRIIGALGFVGIVVVIGWKLYRTGRLLDRRRAAAARLASTDALTGLANRLAFDAALVARHGPAAAHQPFALIAIDLDGFKAINDSYGHAAGDRLLQLVAEHLRAVAGPDDLVARVGGDEFSVLRSAVGVEAFVDAVRQRIASSGSNIAASFGIARSDDFPFSISALMHAADAALYRAKRAGRGHAELAIPAPPMQAA